VRVSGPRQSHRDIVAFRRVERARRDARRHGKRIV
jgi:hypothetical protein